MYASPAQSMDWVRTTHADMGCIDLLMFVVCGGIIFELLRIVLGGAQNYFGG